MGLPRVGFEALCALFLSVALVGCGTRRLALPTDPGRPLPGFGDVAASLTSACAGARTFTAELGLSGRAGTERLRGRVVAGFLRPDGMRLEGVAPFGPPAFVLVSSTGSATLLLPRDNAVLRDTPPRDVLEALTGVALTPADLFAVLTGCVTPDVVPVSGVQHASGWASIVMGSGATFYLQRERDAWRLRAARRETWTIEYPSWLGGFPSEVRLRSDGGAVPVDVSATIAQVEVNVDLPANAFTLEVPTTARAVTIEDLRRSGPLRGAP